MAENTLPEQEITRLVHDADQDMWVADVPLHDNPNRFVWHESERMVVWNDNATSSSIYFDKEQPGVAKQIHIDDGTYSADESPEWIVGRQQLATFLDVEPKDLDAPTYPTATEAETDYPEYTVTHLRAITIDPATALEFYHQALRRVVTFSI